MFPTQHKDKIPKSLAYPAKAKLISEALADIPQLQDLSISFSLQPTSAFHKNSPTCSILYLCYYDWETNQFTPHDFEARREGESPWTLSVEPVPASIKYHVQQLLEDEELPKVRHWLQTLGQATNFMKVHSLRVLYNRDFDRLEYEEHRHS